LVIDDKTGEVIMGLREIEWVGLGVIPT
jgi:hypothetical protein